jgi:hypothetical protein
LPATGDVIQEPRVGPREVQIAELHYVARELSEEGMADLHEVIAGIDEKLQACFDAVQRSEAAAQVTEAQRALRALRQPLLDHLARHRMVADILFSDSFPYCRLRWASTCECTA